MSHVGRPLIFSSLVLVLGFLAVYPSKFVPGARFGVLAACVVMLALMFDLLVLPAMMGLVWSDQQQKSLTPDVQPNRWEQLE